MGKRGNPGEKDYTRGEGCATISGGNTGGAGMKNNASLSVFDFTGSDLRVEAESSRALTKFAPRIHGRKPEHNCPLADKYTFLDQFARGSTQPKDYRSDVFDVDATDGPSLINTNGTDMIISPTPLNYDYPCSSSKQQNFERFPCHTKSHEPASRKLGAYRSQKRKKVWSVDSREVWKDLRLLSSLDVTESQGSSNKQLPEYEANNDCEAVMVSPCYIKYADKHYTSCHLIFSQRCIRLETPQGERNQSHSLEWSTFEFDLMKIEHQQCKSANADVVNLYLKSKVIYITDAGNWSSDIIQVEFVVHDDSEWRRKLVEIKLLDMRYEDAWKTIIIECNFDESFEGIIYPDGDPDAVFINRKDIELLKPRTFINDTIIDFYIKYLVNQTNMEHCSFHFFNTFFFQKLMDMDRDLSRSFENTEDFQRIRKWTRNLNIFEKDYIFIPVNFRLHWSLIVICHPGEVANLKDRDMDSITKVPCILHMDSMRGTHTGFGYIIRSYLWEEWKGRGYKQEEDISKLFSNLEFIPLQLPQQENFFDCGLFLLHYAELFLEELRTFGAIKYPKSLNQDWFLAAEVSLKKRDHIKKLIHEMAKGWSNRNEQIQSDGRSEKYITSSDECEIQKQPSLSAMFEDQSTVNNHFDNSTSPMEVINENPKAPPFPTGDNTATRCEAEADDDLMPEHYHLLSTSESGKTKSSQETTSSRSLIIIDSQNNDDSVSEAERQEGTTSRGSSSISLQACVVDDSEESDTESFRRAR